jgi:MraZ protein
MDDIYTVRVDPPRGTLSARVDEKGRLKLPAAFRDFLFRLDEKVVFITTLDRQTVRIYPIAVWKRNEAFFQQVQQNAKAAADVSMVANHFGADSEVDAQGRVLVPANLRRMLGMENETVWIEHYRGRFNVYSDAVYQEKLANAMEGLPDKVEVLEQQGLQ